MRRPKHGRLLRAHAPLQAGPAGTVAASSTLSVGGGSEDGRGPVSAALVAIGSDVVEGAVGGIGGAVAERVTPQGGRAGAGKREALITTASVEGEGALVGVGVVVEESVAGVGEGSRVEKGKTASTTASVEGEGAGAGVEVVVEESVSGVGGEAVAGVGVWVAVTEIVAGVGAGAGAGAGAGTGVPSLVTTDGKTSVRARRATPAVQSPSGFTVACMAKAHGHTSGGTARPPSRILTHTQRRTHHRQNRSANAPGGFSGAGDAESADHSSCSTRIGGWRRSHVKQREANRHRSTETDFKKRPCEEQLQDPASAYLHSCRCGSLVCWACWGGPV